VCGIGKVTGRKSNGMVRRQLAACVLSLVLACSACGLTSGGHPAAGPIAWVLLASAVLTAVFAPLTAWLYGRQR